MAELTDQIGNLFAFENAPARIVSLVPSQTELLCDLGLESKIVGITKFCVHPFHLKSVKTIVGGTKKVNFEKIAALNPDIIICNKEENTEEMVSELQKSFPVWVTDIITIEDNLQMISDFGQLFNCRTEANKWIGKIQFALTDFTSFIADKPIRKSAYFIWKNPFMVAGNSTFINTIMQLGKFDNIYHDKGRYPEIELQKMRLEGDPEIVFLSSEPYPFKDEDAFEIARFTHHAKVIFVNGEMFSWYGSRLVKTFSYLKKLHNSLG